MVDRQETKSNQRPLTTTSNEIDNLCQLIDKHQFTISTRSKSKYHSVPSSQVKAFRLKRLNGCSTSKTDEQSRPEDQTCRSLVPCARRTFSMRFSLSPSSLIHRFRSLSTLNMTPSTRRQIHFSSHHRRNSFSISSSSITLVRTKSILPSIVEEEPIHDSSVTTQAQLSCTIVDTRRSTANSCNVEELAAYLDNLLYLPKSLSGAAELMYT